MTTVEPEWSDEDRAYATALMDYDVNACPGCGGQLDETTDTSHAYMVHQTTCHKCKAIEAVKHRYHEANKDTEGRSDADIKLWHAEAVPLPTTNGARSGR